MRHVVPSDQISRRHMLQNSAGGFGSLVLTSMLAEAAESGDPLAPQLSHRSQTAKSVIWIFMSGGISQVESFDPKPKLVRDAGKQLSIDNWQGRLAAFQPYLKRPHFGFHPGGESGIEVCDIFPHIREVVDDLCVIRSMSTDHTNHYESTLGMHTGSFSFARPSIGAWVSYGLGTENQNLPSFMVLASKTPYAGTQVWSSDFLPGCHQGTHVVPGSVPIANIKSPTPTRLQQLELDMIHRANSDHQRSRPEEAALEARIRSFETAFGMQAAAPEAFDLSDETANTMQLYGADRDDATNFGSQCLVARRLVERGVRFVEVIDGGSSDNWDAHGDIDLHKPRAKVVDRPIAGLICDLKQRGLLDDTLVVFTTEFGRTPYNVEPDHKGREHHHQCFSSWLAGGGVKGGITYGESDDYGIEVARNKVHVHDFHATILHLLGLDHERLTFRHAGRDYRLTDVAGEVVHEIIA